MVEQKCRHMDASVTSQPPPAVFIGVSVRNLAVQGLQSCMVLVCVPTSLQSQHASKDPIRPRSIFGELALAGNTSWK